MAQTQGDSSPRSILHARDKIINGGSYSERDPLWFFQSELDCFFDSERRIQILCSCVTEELVVIHSVVEEDEMIYLISVPISVQSCSRE